MEKEFRLNGKAYAMTQGESGKTYFDGVEQSDFSGSSINWSSSSWKVVDTTSYLYSEAGSTATTTSYVASANFMPGAITVEGIS